MAKKHFPQKLVLGITLIAFLIGCGGRLIPRDLKDFVSADLKIERRRVEFQMPYRSEITLRVNPMSYRQAQDAQKSLIESCKRYFQRDNIDDFINDSLVFIIRLDEDASTVLKYWSHIDEMTRLMEDELTTEQFIERCKKEESWVDEEF